MINAIQLLVADHRKLKQLAKKVAQTSEKAGKTRQEMFKIIKVEATLHEKVEEKFLYPLLKEYKLSRPNAFEHHEEVLLMNHLIAKLAKGPCNTEEWTAKFAVFKELTEDHIEEEEDEFFPHANKLLSAAQLKEIGAKIQQFKKLHKK